MRQSMTKPTKSSVRQAKTQINLGIHPVWSVFTVHMKKSRVHSYPLSVQQRLISLSHRWVQRSFFCFAMRRLKCHFPWQTCLSWQFSSAPLSNSILTISTWPMYDAQCMARRSFLSKALIVAPWSNRSLIIWKTGDLNLFVPHMSRLMTKPTKWHVRPVKTQISLGIRPVWSESSLSAWRKIGSLANHWVHSENSGCPGWSESSLGAVILLVLSCAGSSD